MTPAWKLAELGIVTTTATISAGTAAEVAIAAPPAFGHALGALFGTLAFAGYVAHRAPEGEALRRTGYKVASGMLTSFFGALVATPMIVHLSPGLAEVPSGALAGTVAILAVTGVEVANALLKRKATR